MVATESVTDPFLNYNKKLSYICRFAEFLSNYINTFNTDSNLRYYKPDFIRYISQKITFR